MPETVEQQLARWAVDVRFEDLPVDVVADMKLLVRTIIGTSVAGATAPGCAATVDLVKQWGGAPQATIWLYGGKAPVHAAALANSTMARALDICDAQVPGQHIGTSLVPVALGIAEMLGNVSGRDLVTALAVGSEIATRLGFVSRLDGFDPTGACSIFAPTIAAGRLLGLTAKQMLHAMALVFNRAGSSFQSNIDASLAVRLIEGFISQNAVVCAELAKRDMTGPVGWLTGQWGYFHLFCKDERDVQTLTGGLGETWLLRGFGYKTRPQCGATIASTDALLGLLAGTPFSADEVERIDINMANEGPCFLVGSPFVPGDYPQVNGQFSVRYCVANAIIRGEPQLHHFTDEAVMEPALAALANRVHVHLKPELMEGRRELAARAVLDVKLKDGRVLQCQADGPSGFPPNQKSAEMHRIDFDKHIAYGGMPLADGHLERINDIVNGLDANEDPAHLPPLLVSNPR